MKIHSNAPISATNSETHLLKRMDSSLPATDRIRTSNKAQMLSRNLETLREQLLPRNAILKKFAGRIDDPLNLKNKEIDRILSRL